MKYTNNLKILFFRKKFNQRFSIFNQLELSKIDTILPHDVDLIYGDTLEELDKANIIIFDVPFLLSHIVNCNITKKDGQIWVGWCLECEENYPWIKYPMIHDLFDFWMTYHLDSDVVLPYYDVTFLTRLFIPPLPKNKNVCMLISSMINQSKRQEYLLELMRYLSIDSYGKWQNNCLLPNDRGYLTKLELMKDYRFTIAFENAIGKDYVTEKFFDPLLSGSVPIYWGAPNIETFSPGDNSFLDVRQYPEPKKLAEDILEYCEDNEKYNHFFEWKTNSLNPTFKALLKQQIKHPLIRLIELVRNSNNISLSLKSTHESSIFK